MSSGATRRPVKSTTPVAEARIPCARQADRSTRSPRSTIGVSIQIRPSASRAVRSGTRDQTRARAIDLAAAQASAAEARRQMQPLGVVGGPDAEQRAAASLFRHARDLGRLAISRDKPDRVGVPLIEPRERQAGAPEAAQDRKEDAHGALAMRDLRAAERRGKRRRQEAGAMKRGDFGDRQRQVAVHLLRALRRSPRAALSAAASRRSEARSFSVRILRRQRSRRCGHGGRPFRTCGRSTTASSLAGSVRRGRPHSPPHGGSDAKPWI